jgi:acyl-CoA thioesterase YciA
VNNNTFEEKLTVRVVAMPADTNATGDIFGGWLMSQVDIAGSIIAVDTVSCRVVTVAVKHFQFIKPVYVGDLVSCYAQVVKTGKTSLTVNIRAVASRKHSIENAETVADAQLVYVAVDEKGKPVKLQ